MEIVDNFREITDLALESTGRKDRGVLSELIDILMKRNLNEKALFVTEKVLEKEEKNNEFIEKKGHILTETGRFDEAAKLFRKLIRRDPENPHYHNLLGDCHRLSGRKDLAIKQYQKAVETRRYDLVSIYEEFDAREGLSFLHYEEGKYDLARREILAVIKKNSRHPLWRLLFKTLEKIDDKSALEKARKDYDRAKSAEKQFLRGEDLRDAGDTGIALEYYKNAVKTYPEEPEYHYAVGNIYLEEKDFDSAEFHLGRALDIFPENERYLLALTGCLIGMEKYGEAYKYTYIGVKHSPSYFIDSYEMISMNLGRIHDYIKTLKEIVESDKSEKFPELRHRLGKAYKRLEESELSQKWFEEAVRILEKKKDEDPSDWKNFAILGDALREVGKPDSALGNYLEARELIRKKHEPTKRTKLEENIAEIYNLLGEYNLSVETYESLSKIYPDRAAYPREIGVNYIKTGDMKQARKHLERALGMDERDPGTLYYLSVINCATKNFGNSIKFLKRAIMIDPEYYRMAKKEESLSPLFKNGLVDNILKHEEVAKSLKDILS
ncbi:MAG: tetratricopeptide repeat protein [Candidatus Eremiobacteraeota bacterium]|nr:tetratricopeptide repeat protein [Candidatus Eremiobacteraeota bacterium]